MSCPPVYAVGVFRVPLIGHTIRCRVKPCAGCGRTEPSAPQGLHGLARRRSRVASVFADSTAVACSFFLEGLSDSQAACAAGSPASAAASAGGGVTVRGASSRSSRTSTSSPAPRPVAARVAALEIRKRPPIDEIVLG